MNPPLAEMHLPQEYAISFQMDPLGVVLEWRHHLLSLQLHHQEPSPFHIGFFGSFVVLCGSPHVIEIVTISYGCSTFRSGCHQDMDKWAKDHVIHILFGRYAG